MNLIPHDTKQGSVTRRLDPEDLYGYQKSVKTPAPGDLVLCRVVRVEYHSHLESRSCRRLALFPGDHIMGVFGSRYALGELEGVVPSRLQRIQLLAPSGVVGQVQSRNRMIPPPTELEALGYVFDEEAKRVSLQRSRLKPRQAVSVPTVLVLGSEMKSGKTTTVICLIRALFEQGLRVGAARITGTANRTDLLRMWDAGAAKVLDFTVFGHPSTYLLEETDLLEVFNSTLGHLAGTGVDVVVLEMGDGILQQETTLLLTSDDVHHHVDAVLFSACDVLNASAAHEILIQHHDLPLRAVTGPVANSALGIREVENRIGLPCFSAMTSSRVRVVDVMRKVFPELLASRESLEGPALVE